MHSDDLLLCDEVVLTHTNWIPWPLHPNSLYSHYPFLSLVAQRRRQIVKVADFGTSTLYDLNTNKANIGHHGSRGSTSVNLSEEDEYNFPEPGHETVNLLVTETQGTLAFMAPECHTERKFGPSSDVYSFGIVLWEIVTRLEAPYAHIRVSSSLLSLQRRCFRAV